MKPKLFVSILVLMCPLMFMFSQTDDLNASVARGKTVYETSCVGCHMADGVGLEGAFPPLAKTNRLSDKARLVKVLLNGMNEPITISGNEYATEMAPQSLSDEEVADVLNYIRNSWGNKGDIIKTTEISSLKQ